MTEETNPYQAGSEVSFATKNSQPRKSHGLAWFFIAVVVMVTLSTLGRNFRMLRHNEFFVLSGIASLVCSGIGLSRACVGINKIIDRSPLSSLINFLSFFLNTIWSLLIVYVLSSFLFAWINSQ